jgi:hypothetical protein
VQALSCQVIEYSDNLSRIEDFGLNNFSMCYRGKRV